MGSSSDLRDATAASERDFYRRLLDLGSQREVEPLLEQALALIVEVTGASTGYLELYEDDRAKPAPRFWKAHRITEEAVASIRASISHGIIARAIGEGRTIETASASADVRFADLGSVRQHAIQAVLCAPVGRPAIGVIYLQGRSKPGQFTAADREHVELFARQLAPLADRLVRRDPDRVDHTRPIRERMRCPEIVGHSRALARLLHGAANVAHLDVDVLITGPSGTGKSLLAHVIAANSPRGSGPFVELNCAAIPENLLESELFGAERGAHSTATSARRGKVAAAEGGTLFLDEVGELSAAAQAKLLQLLETRTYHPLGSAKPVSANVRVLSATNADLEDRIAAKQFRADLYYRLHVVPLEVPGLEARRDDIPELVEYFCAEACKKHKLPPLDVAWQTLVACERAAWPGHTRQLSHAIEAAVIRASGDHATTLAEHHVFPPAETDPAPVAQAEPRTLQAATRQFQRQLVLDALERCDWNIKEAARELGLVRSHVYNLINDFELRSDPRFAANASRDESGEREAPTGKTKDRT